MIAFLFVAMDKDQARHRPKTVRALGEFMPGPRDLASISLSPAVEAGFSPQKVAA